MRMLEIFLMNLNSSTKLAVSTTIKRDFVGELIYIDNRLSGADSGETVIQITGDLNRNFYNETLL